MAGPSKEDIYKAFNTGTLASKKKKQRKLQRVIRTMKKETRREQAKDGSEGFAALQLLHDPQSFSERLFGRLQAGPLPPAPLSGASDPLAELPLPLHLPVRAAAHADLQGAVGDQAGPHPGHQPCDRRAPGHGPQLLPLPAEVHHAAAEGGHPRPCGACAGALG